MGASNIVRAIGELELPVETVVGISTDKACKPVNVMGMTKAIAERIFTAANVLNAAHAVRVRPVRQRAGVARIGHSAVPSADPPRRAGDGDGPTR